MNKISAFLFILIASLIVISCKKKTPPPESLNLYSFFVAGHTYGKPGGDGLGFHPAFKNEFNFIRSYPNISFGILTGDIVQQSNEESWDAIDDEILQAKLCIAIEISRCFMDMPE